MGVGRERASDEHIGFFILFSPLLYVLNSSKVKFSKIVSNQSIPPSHPW